MSIFNDWFSLTNPGSPAPGTIVDPTIYLSLWSRQRGENEHVKCVAEDFPVNRLDEKGKIVSHEVGQFGIHLHSGGPGEDVNQYSAGCQIIWSPEGYFGATWHRFFDPAQKAMQDNNQSILPYMLVDATTLPSQETPSSP